MVKTIGFSILTMILGVIAISVVSYITYSNLGVSYETRLNAKLNDNKQILGQYTIKIKEMAQVPDMYTKDLTKVLETIFTGRYGDTGSTASMQWIKEYNPKFDPSLYIELQKAISYGRTEFTNNQTQLLDIKRSYEASLSYVWSGFWLKTAGFPKLDLDKINVIVASNTEQVFDSGVDTPIQLN